MARLEAVLFLAREPLGTRKLGELADLADGTEARTLIRKLGRLYDEEVCAFHVMEVAGGFQLVSRPQFAPYLRRLHGPTAEVRLSAPAMETLSVVAYRQPVLRTTIESIRGVQCGELLRQLMERDLVRIVGRSEDLGRPFLYGTTRRFLQVFGLRHLDELPPVETELAIDQMPGISRSDLQRNDGHPQRVAPDKSRMTEEEPTVKIQIEGQELVHPLEELSEMPLHEPIVRSEMEGPSFAADEEEDDYDYAEDDEEDDDDEDDEEDDFEDDDFEDSDDELEEEEEEEDDGFEDTDWEEVDDDDEEEEEDADWEEDDWEEEEEADEEETDEEPDDDEDDEEWEEEEEEEDEDED
ncbi:MAG: SMC-Scp complex subunit ScpB [Thermoguttaceae bacterium]